MLHNVFIDLVGNFSLVFVWTGEQFHNVFWTLIGEDPITGQPFVLCDGPCADIEQAARAAWVCVTTADWFAVGPAVEGLPPISDVWRRSFGSSFSRITHYIKTGQGEVSGVVYIKYLKRGVKEQFVAE